MVAKTKAKKKVVADYDMRPSETAREWYERRAREWAQGFDFWMGRRIENFSRAIRNMKEVV